MVLSPNLYFCYCVTDTSTEISNFVSQASKRPKSSRLGSAAVTPSRAAARCKLEMQAYLEEKAVELMNYFGHQNMEALINAIKNALDCIRKRIHATITVSYKGKSEIVQDNPIEFTTPVFRTNFVLEIPNISISPAHDEIQNCINTCVLTIVGVSKEISQWETYVKGLGAHEGIGVFSKGDLSTRSCSISSHVDDNALIHHVGMIPAQHVDKSYYKFVSKNKEINKLVISLSTIINSQKKEITAALNRYVKYAHIWMDDRTKVLHEFAALNPSLDDFERKILYYKALEEEISMEDEWISAGSVALYTGKILFSHWRENYLFSLNMEPFYKSP